MSEELYKILLVDDDEDEFFIFQDYLEDSIYSFHVDWVASYEEALNKFKDNSYDAFVVDYYLG
ncbi:MAG: hybrid sensor histidine kinase/response regulator, partial [Flavobacteriales bacterium]|nr:hybrid sensor histidine kinase/response regulator [Flavobacteriales bacterium]